MYPSLQVYLRVVELYLYLSYNLYIIVANNIGFTYEVCEVSSYTQLVKELQSERAALTMSGFYETTTFLSNVTFLTPIIISYTLSILMRYAQLHLLHKY